MAEKKISEERAAALKSNLKQSSIQNAQRVSGIFDNPKSGGSKQSIVEKKIFEGATINKVSPKQENQKPGITNVDHLSRPVLPRENLPGNDNVPATDEFDDEEKEGIPDEPFGQDLNNSQDLPDRHPQVSRRTEEDLKQLQNEQLGASNPNGELPGGKTQTAEPKKIVSNNEESGLVKNSANKARQSGGQAASAANDFGKRMAKQAAQLAVKAKDALLLIYKSPVALIITAIILALLIFVILFGIYYARSNSSPNPQGKSPLVQTDPLTDKEWIQEVLMLAGDKDTSKLISDAALNKMKNELTNIKTQIEKDNTLSTTDKAGYLAKIDLILPKIDSAKLASDTDKKKILAGIVTSIGELAQTFLSVTALPASLATSLPVKVALNTFNTHPHLGTVGWPSTATPKDYPSPARTFLQTGNGTCDAVDLKVGGNVDVFAAFSGKITRVSGAPGIENSENKVIAIYGHVDLDGGLSTGSDVKAGDHIGKTQVSQGHLHFELARGSSNNTWKCVANSGAEINSAKAANWPENQVGKTLWDKMLLVLHSPK